MDARFEIVASGYGLAEAPLAHLDGGVVFSDVLGGGVHHWSPADGQVRTLVERRRGVGGLAWHADGGLVVSGRAVEHIPPGGEASRLLLSGGEAAGYNDLTVDAAGRVLVGELRFRPFAGEAPAPGVVWRLDAPAAARPLWPARHPATGKGVDAGAGSRATETGVGAAPAAPSWPNGIALAPDGTTVYICDFAPGLVVAVDLDPDGTVRGAPRVVVRTSSGDADGLAVDATGSLWVALGSGGAVARYTPAGALDSVLEVPAGFVSSVAFGGADGRDLFVTTADSTLEPERGGCVLHTRAPVDGLERPAVTL